MLRAACHCTAVRLEIAEAPAWVLDCNCTICRRYGALWAYPDAAKVKLVRGADASDVYTWGDGMIAFHRCRECGCITHMTALDVDPPRIFGVNARMAPTLDPAKVTVVQIDNGHSGFFWTRSLRPPETGRHPKMDRPGPEDWR